MTEVRLPASVKATFVDNISAAGTPPGAFKYWTDGSRIAGMNFRCPCGCGHLSTLSFRPLAPEDAGDPSWAWDGNREAPTLSPSVHRVGHWHGWLKAGFWTQA